MIIHCMTEELWNKRKDEKEWGDEEIEVEGFIHCSTVEYFWRVAESHFNNLIRPLVLLCIDESKLKSEVRYEDGDNCGRYYPHIYGLVNNDAVIKVLPFLKDKDGNYIKNAEFKDIDNK